MQKVKPFSQHFLFLSALFILGEGIIILPLKNATRLTFLGFLIAFLIAALVFFAVIKLDFLKYPVLLIAVFSALKTFITFLKFISSSLLKDMPNILILIIFIIPLLYFCFRKTTEILNFSLLSGVLCAGLIIFFFFATFKDFSFENIFIYSLPNVKDLFSQSLMYIKSITLPIAVLALYAKQIKVPKAKALLSLGFSCGLLLVCIFNSILLFGTDLAGRLYYPYATAISTVTFGDLFFRLDGFSYFIYFVSALVKITVCVKTVANLKANKKLQ